MHLSFGDRNASLVSAACERDACVWTLTKQSRFCESSRMVRSSTQLPSASYICRATSESNCSHPEKSHFRRSLPKKGSESWKPKSLGCEVSGITFVRNSARGAGEDGQE